MLTINSHPNSIVICALYYVTWIYLLPWLRHYKLRSEILSAGGTAATHRLVKVPTKNLAAWDSAHDASGRLLVDRNEKEGGLDGFKL